MREKYVEYFKDLRERIITAFEEIEGEKRFERSPWKHHSGGGGEMGVLRGDVFEKAGVNFSAVEGDTFPGADGKGPFNAAGVSLITHMMSPLMPTVHMNVRYIETPNKTWVGGGFDLTPMGLPNESDTHHFHTAAKEALDRLDTTLYPRFSEWAAEYFFIKHRNKERGVGGIFFDHEEPSLDLIKAVGEGFLEAILPIYRAKKDLPYTSEEKAIQNKHRAHYVEFNLLYDRGTKFGFNSGGNPEAILVSMPPVAHW